MLNITNPLSMKFFTSFGRFLLAGFSLIFLFGSCSTEISGIMTDNRDGRQYEAVVIGDQTWMAENLKYLPYVSPADSDSGIYVYGYEGNLVDEAWQTEEYQTYGVLYNWATAMGLPNYYNMHQWDGSDNDRQGICPDGWHLPSQKEWETLEAYLISEFHGTDSSNMGSRIKSTGRWKDYGNGTNETGFSLMPSGFRYNEGFFDKIERYGYLWTSTQCPSSCELSARYKYLVYTDMEIHSSYPSKKCGFPVRCIKDR